MPARAIVAALDTSENAQLSMLELERGRDKPQYARFITWLLDDRERFAALDADGTKTVDVPELAEAGPVWAQLWTKRVHSVDLVLFGPPGAIPLGRVAELGSKREITTYKDGRDAVKISFRSLKQARHADVSRFLEEHRAACEASQNA